ncbi:hypothetical protein Asulf_02145 [Archaeoglobus sulfaticallidus PM70-1]|uniref:Thioredoxin-like fold domain-containing protein n=1 Tax=Archaeoglobus sulfaticallidus PM70-1 TaxID=387631 RepID=N0BP29_9EURY|nr:hypothetical protein [Archaeoglobus sulfaticallidus]AGK62100.1 hypothetical protein Asulf_02145 [Archaeoglobus sulfaticallidus PM70-1]
MEVVIYRNKPAGARCNQLAENVLMAIADNIDEIEKEIVVKILYVKEKVVAPAIEVEGRMLGENLSMEEIINNFSPERIAETIKS